MLMHKIFRIYMMAIAVGLGIGFVLGVIKGLTQINSNQYLNYGFYNIAFDSLRSSLNHNMAICLIIFCTIFTIFYFLISPMARWLHGWFKSNTGFNLEIENEDNFRAFIIALIISMLVYISIAFYINNEILTKFLTTRNQILLRLVNINVMTKNLLAIVVCILLTIPLYKMNLIYILKVMHNPRSSKISASLGRVYSRGIVFILIITVALNGLDIYKNLNAQENQKDLNLVLISIDTLRADHLSSYGYYRKTSPNIDTYAHRGVLFEQAISSSSWTVPAHMSLFTSLNPLRDNIFLHPAIAKLRSDYLTLAEIMKEAGYTTAGFSGGGNVSANFGFDQGFDIYKSRGRHFEDNEDLVYRWLDKNRKQKFFLFLHGYNVHRPYLPPYPFNKRFLPDYDGKLNIRAFDGTNQKLEEKDLQYVISQYDGEISFVDDIIKRLFDKLSEFELLEHTLVIITSDHGDAFFEHGHTDHISSLYEELIHIPLIIIGPNVPKGVRVSAVVRIVDILPSVLELLSIKMPERYKYEFEGVSLIPFMHNHATEDLYAFSATGYSQFPYYIYSVRRSKSKLIFNNLSGMDDDRFLKRVHFGAMVRDGKLRSEFDDSFELYNLEEDPNEKSNIMKKNYEVSKLLKDKLHYNLKSIAEEIVTNKEKVKYSRELEEQLKSLGYLN